MCSHHRRMSKVMIANIKARRGFTLIELMIVVVIIAILAVLLLPMLSEDDGRCSFTDTSVRKARDYRECVTSGQCQLTGEQFALMRKVELAGQEKSTTPTDASRAPGVER